MIDPILLVFAVLSIGVVFKVRSEPPPITLDSLCVMSSGKCYRDGDKIAPKPPEAMEGFLCTSEPDFRKITEKLKRTEE